MLNISRTLIFILFSNCVAFAVHAEIKDANLEAFRQSSPYWKAIQTERESLVKEFEARDLVVAPTLNLEATNFVDDRNQLMVLPIKHEELLLSAKLSKYFSTGTTVDFATSTTSTTYSTGPLARDTNHIGNFQLSLSQNLWRDAFGESDRIRRRQNEREYELRKLQLDLDQANLLIRFEEALWNYMAASYELKLRESSLKNWVEIERWMKGRFSRSAAELVDVKQISATKILREIQVQTVSQNLTNLKRDLDQIGGEGFSSKITLDDKYLDANPSEILNLEEAYSLQTLILERTAAVTEQQMEATLQNSRPSLKLNLSVNRIGLEDSRLTAFQDAYGLKDFYTLASVVFSTPIDFSLLKSGKDSAKLKYQAASLRRDQSMSAAKLEWSNLKGQISEHFNRIKLLKQLTKEQTQRNRAENQRFKNGRSTALQVVTAEQETLDAELTLRTTQAAFKKLIARYRLFDFPKPR